MKEKSSTIIDDAQLIVARFMYLKNFGRKNRDEICKKLGCPLIRLAEYSSE